MPPLNATLSLMIFIALTIPSITIAEPAEPETDAYENCVDPTSESAVDLLPTYQQHTVDGIRYISGGVGKCEVLQLKTIAKNFPLEIVFVEKHADRVKENYIADTQVRLFDDKDVLVLEVWTEGPFLLIHAPEGRYRVEANYKGMPKTAKTVINHKKHKRMVFQWSEKDLPKDE